MDSTLESSQNKIVQFIRKKDYRLIRELGRGSCGQTVLLHDDSIDEFYVCKKYDPANDTYREDLYKAFMQEIKLMHSLHHPNVVRIFNSYLYPSTYSGYILMEFIDGLQVEQYIESNKSSVDEVFRQAIAGYAYMEDIGILHRDIRPGNLMVAKNGAVKIIDLGFSKKIIQTADFNKSISLNWWCELPDEFQSNIYNFGTEVYFVGKLFEKIINNYSISDFSYSDILREMCHIDPSRRMNSFKVVLQKTRNEKFSSFDFSDKEKKMYRKFADALCGQITKIDKNSSYIKELDIIRKNLQEIYKGSILEERVSSRFAVPQCLIKGQFYANGNTMPVAALRDFLELLNSNSEDRRSVILAGIYTRLDAILRYSENKDDVPF